jgi:regulator of nucleoside diphosphate kinase
MDRTIFAATRHGSSMNWATSGPDLDGISIAIRLAGHRSGHRLDEIDRAELLPWGDMPTDVVTMHTHVEYRDDETSAIRRIQLVYPHEADITRGMISVLTLVGAGLIGLSAGQSILWPKQDGRKRSLTVLRVSSRPLGSESA